MEGLRSNQQTVRFGPFELDQASGELRKNGAKIRLQEQPLQILKILLEQPGSVVTREELQRRIWPSDTFVDFDHGINNAIKRLREALADTAEEPHYIETLPRRGYRFVGTYIVAEPEETRSIAVLPFLNLSSDPENELFCDGTTEEIINALSRINNLHVVARTSAFAFKGKHVDVRAVGRELDVQNILEGSIRKSGNYLRITAQLVNAADGYHLWSEKYDRGMKDVFAVQEEIANSIAQRLEVSLDSGPQPLLRAGTASVEAFKYYTQGRALFFQRGARLLPAVECFKKAVTLDSNYALAWSGLADAYNMVGFYGLARPDACMPHAKEAAQRAVALDPSLAEAHTSLAMSHLLFDWDRSAAEHEFLVSLRLKPHSSFARTWYGLFYLNWSAGCFEEASAQISRAVLIDPLSAWCRAMQAAAYLPHDVEQCLVAVEETLKIDPDYFLGRWFKLVAFTLKKCFAEAEAWGDLAVKMSGRFPWMICSLARAYSLGGKRADSEALYMELHWRSQREHVSPAALAWAAWAAGYRDEAIRFVQKAHSIGDPLLVAAKYWPDFEELRGDARFQEILQSRGWR